LFVISNFTNQISVSKLDYYAQVKILKLKGFMRKQLSKNIKY